jgi:hypothetical protein
MSKQKKRPIRAIFPLEQNVTSKDIVESAILKNLLKTSIPECISNALKEKKIYACIFEINDTNHFVEIHKKDWISALEACVIFYAEDEEYEKCSEVNNLIKEIKEKQSHTPKIKIK